MEYPISLDTALQIVGSLKVRAIKEKSATNNIMRYSILVTKSNSLQLKIRVSSYM